MDEPRLPAQLVDARRTPLFDFATVPDALSSSHRTTVWAELRVQAGAVLCAVLPGTRFIDWQAHIRTVAEIDVIESHRHLHDRAPFTPDLFDRR